MKKILTIGVIACFFAACEKESIISPGTNLTPYSFYIAGHTYGEPGIDNIGLHPPFQNKFDFLNNDSLIQFGVLTGDIVWTSTEKNWTEVDSVLLEVEKPVYFAAGNHDLTNRDLYESRYGSTYRSFIHQSDLFVILDPNIDHWNISGDQLTFLKNELMNQADYVDNIFVFFHQLLWWEDDNIYKNITINSTQGRSDSINFYSEVLPLFTTLSKPVFMFAGDVGANPTGDEFMYHQYNENITFIASGMGGNIRDNFIIIDVKEDKTVAFRLIALNGTDINALGRLEDYELE